MIKTIPFSLFVVLGILLFTVVSCEKPETFPPEPEIKFKSFQFFDSIDGLGNKVKRGELIFTLIDGDGDVGLRDTDTTGKFHKDSLYYNDLFVKLFTKKNGKFEEVKLLIPHNYRLPYLTPEGQNKTLKAEVKIKLEYNIAFFPYDTIRYDFFVADRFIHVSNTVSSPEIPLKYKGIITIDKSTLGVTK